MSHKIKVDVKSAIEDFYPRLTVDQVNYMSDRIHARFDYSSIYDTIHDEITEIAYKKGIDLTDKDEPQVPPDLRLVQ
mgnify:CR=1 FL=1